MDQERELAARHLAMLILDGEKPPRGYLDHRVVSGSVRIEMEAVRRGIAREFVLDGARVASIIEAEFGKQLDGLQLEPMLTKLVADEAKRMLGQLEQMVIERVSDEVRRMVAKEVGDRIDRHRKMIESLADDAFMAIKRRTGEILKDR